MRWYRYIVNWSLKDQIVVAATIKQAARRWQPGLPSLGQWTVARGLVVLGPTLVVGALAWWLWRSGRWGRFVGARRSVPEFYRRALAILARRGVRPAAGETAREFCARVGAEVPVWSVPFAAVTIAYERVRFGAHALAAADVGELDIALAALAARDASRP